jgi:hypothetical protein
MKEIDDRLRAPGVERVRLMVHSGTLPASHASLAIG